MADQPLLLGEAPSKSGDRYYMFPLSGAVAETLCKLAGIQPQPGGTRYGRWTWALYDHFECENLIERYPGAQGRGAAFPQELSRPLALKFAQVHRDRVVVLLGTRLASVFGVPAFCQWQDHVEVLTSFSTAINREPARSCLRVPAQVAMIPHPSGLNRMLNDPVERERAGAVLREAMQRASVVHG